MCLFSMSIFPKKRGHQNMFKYSMRLVSRQCSLPGVRWSCKDCCIVQFKHSCTVQLFETFFMDSKKPELRYACSVRIGIERAMGSSSKTTLL